LTDGLILHRLEETPEARAADERNAADRVPDTRWAARQGDAEQFGITVPRVCNSSPGWHPPPPESISN